MGGYKKVYSLEKKDGSLDYPKRQILLVQENYKVFVPLLLVLVIGLSVLNIFNAVRDFMAVYICVLVNAVGVGAGIGILWMLVRDNRRQRNLFAQILEKTAVAGAFVRNMRYESDTDGILKGARDVCLYDTENAYVVVPNLPQYRHRLFTRYDFRGDFGRLILPKEEYDLAEEGSAFRFLSAHGEFVFFSHDAVVRKK